MPRSVRKRNSEESYKAILRSEVDRLLRKKRGLAKYPLGMEYAKRRSSKVSQVSHRRSKRGRPKRKSVKQRGGIVRAGSHQQFPKCK